MKGPSVVKRKEHALQRRILGPAPAAPFAGRGMRFGRFGKEKEFVSEEIGRFRGGSPGIYGFGRGLFGGSRRLFLLLDKADGF